MKHPGLFTLIALLCCTSLLKAQNFVSNGSFEFYSSCPLAVSSMSNATNWYAYSSGSPDYFHTCGATTVNIPVNRFGIQPSVNGNGYAGGFSFTTLSTTPAFVEYISCQMTSLVPGITYNVSMSASLADTSGYAHDGLAMYFFKNGPTSILNSDVLSFLTPQVSFAGYGILADKQNWVRLSGNFLADSAYDHLIIGCFKPVTAMNIQNVASGTESYYYYDSVVVSFANVLSINDADSVLCAGDVIQVPFWVKHGTSLNPGNIFTLQLSDATGSFATPTAIGSQSAVASGIITTTVPATITPGNSYRLRVVSNNPVLTSNISLKPISIGVVKPTKPVIVANNPVCACDNLMLTTSSTTGASFRWTGPNNFISTDQNVVINTVAAINGGDYIVKARLYGCFSSDTETVVVTPLPASVTASANTPLCAATTLNLSGTSSTPGSTYSWAGHNGFASTLQNTSIPNMPLNGGGMYIYTATRNGCSAKDTVEVTVWPTPQNVVANSNSPVCEGQNLYLSVTNTTPGVSYSWVGPNGFTSTSQNPGITGATTQVAGTYTITLTSTGCSAATSVGVTVKQTPLQPTAGSNSPVCTSNDIHLFANGVTPGCTYNWTGPGNFSSTLQNPIISNANSGMGGIYNVVLNLNGCLSVPNTTNVSILSLPASVALYTLPNDTICSGNSVQFVAVPTNGGIIPQYQWVKNGFNINGATSINYITSNLVTGDKLSVLMTPDNSCPQPYTSDTVKMTVLPYVPASVNIKATPGALISPWQTITFTATPVNGGGNPSYQWKRNGQDINGAVYDTWSAYTLYNNDTIWVELLSSEYCPAPANATSNKIIVAWKTGIDDVKNENGFMVYPNPNNGTFTLEGNMNYSAEAEIWNELGQVVYKEVLQPTNGILRHTITLNKTIAPGVYLLRLKTNTESKMIRFTISK